MTLPEFAPAEAPFVDKKLTRTQVAARLGVHLAALDKMIRAGMLQRPPFMESAISRIEGRKRLQVVEGELTVLRTDARERAREGEDREFIGFHTEHTNDLLEETSLRWWRSDPDRVLDNQLFAVTVGTYPVALYRLTERAGTITRDDEDVPRHHYKGQLLARVTPGMVISIQKDIPGYLQRKTEQLMNSRIVVNSGGPVGYLGVDG